MRSLNQIFSKLGLSQENGLYITIENKWIGLFSNRVERLISNVIKPNAFFCIDKKPFILFFERIENKQEKLKEIWNFNESPVVIIIEADAVEIYNGYNYISSEETLQQFGTDDQLTDFSYFELVTGKTWERHLDDLSYDKRVDFHLLENIKAARNLLISHPGGITKELANSLLGKIIFVRYLIDRKIKIDFERNGNSRNWTNDEFCALLNNKGQVKAFFRYLKDKFNGDLFPISDDEFDQIPDGCLHVIISLLSGNEIGTGQTSFFDLYDFSIIPVEFISNVYELFIGQNEQEEQGAYYTPLFLVDYILAETVEKRFRQFAETSSCKVLDPACGSGIFLVETLRKIIEQFQKNNPEFNANPESYKESLRTLACENIYGVDKDPSAVNVAIFSIYLTLLDYQSPSNIETFKFPPLLDKNFFVSDFFNSESEFNSKFDEIKFAFILGNPPWKGNSIGELGKQYLFERRKREKPKHLEHEIAINNGELAEGFMLRVSDFTQPNTEIAFIIRSQILYNPGYSKNFSHFRRYFLQEFKINQIFELAPVRRKVFVNAIAPACIVMYKYAFGESTRNHTVEHISLKPNRFFNLFRVMSIQRNDVKNVNQGLLIDNDWLLKTLVYGNYLDFNFISRLRSNFKSIRSKIDSDDQLLIGTGIQFSCNEKEDSTELIGRDFIETKGINPFYIDENQIKPFKKYRVHRKRNILLYDAPMLLVREGISTTTFQARCAVSTRNLIFKNTVAVIKSKEPEAITVLKNIAAVLSSDLFSYAAITTFSSIGVERERAMSYDKFSLPFIDSEIITREIEKIELLKKSHYDSSQPLYQPEIDNKFKESQAIINSEIFKILKLSKIEKALIDYSIQVLIPLIQENSDLELISRPLEMGSKYLENYIDIFLGRFNDAYEKFDLELHAEIIHSSQILGVFFKLRAKTRKDLPTVWKSSSNSDILKKIVSLGTEKITDQLFIQKDIRGFEKDGFYIIKPNEKRLWHNAIGYLDVNEFADAMLTSGKNNTLNVR